MCAWGSWCVLLVERRSTDSRTQKTWVSSSTSIILLGPFRSLVRSLVGRGRPGLGGQDIPGRFGSISNISRESENGKGWLFVAKHTEHILDKGPNFVAILRGRTQLFQFGNHGNRLGQTILHDLLLFFQFKNQFTHIVQTAFAVRTIGGRLHNGRDFVVAQNHRQGCWRRRRQGLSGYHHRHRHYSSMVYVIQDKPIPQREKKDKVQMR